MSKITVAIPVYNSANTLRRAIESVLNQTFQDFEILVIDDGSTDSPTSVLNEIKSCNLDKTIRGIRHEKNLGRSAARNKAVQLACGEYIAWLDADDVWMPEKLEKQIQLIQNSDNSCQGVICGYYHMKPKESKQVVLPNYQRTSWLLYCLEHFNLALGTTLLMRSAAYRLIGLYDEDLTRSEDQDWILRYLTMYSLASVDEPLAIYHDLRPLPVEEIEAATISFIEKHKQTYNQYGLRGDRALAEKWRYLANLYQKERQDRKKALRYFRLTYQTYSWQNPKTFLLFLKNMICIKLERFFPKSK